MGLDSKTTTSAQERTFMHGSTLREARNRGAGCVGGGVSFPFLLHACLPICKAKGAESLQRPFQI